MIVTALPTSLLGVGVRLAETDISSSWIGGSGGGDWAKAG
jgi:hypothetical protein